MSDRSSSGHTPATRPPVGHTPATKGSSGNVPASKGPSGNVPATRRPPSEVVPAFTGRRAEPFRINLRPYHGQELAVRLPDGATEPIPQFFHNMVTIGEPVQIGDRTFYNRLLDRTPISLLPIVEE